MHLQSISLLTALLGGIAYGLAVPESHYVHEKRTSAPVGWVKRDLSLKRDAILDKRSMTTMRVALTQPNIHKGDVWLDEVSSPYSSKYGQHWTMDKVKESFAPSDETVEAVRSWLVSSGISASSIRQSKSEGFLDFRASIFDAEKLLQTEYEVWHSADDNVRVACDEYSLPHGLRDHVDFVVPTLQFSAPLEKRTLKRDVASVTAPYTPLKAGPSTPFEVLAVKGCDSVITPACLRQLYSIANGTTALVKNAIGVFETDNYYQPRDLDLFFKTYGPPPVGTRPVFDSIDGGAKVTSGDFDSIGEADLDLQYAMTLVYPQNVTLYQVGDQVEGGDFNTFLEAIDGSYCTNDTSINQYDPTYPDPSNSAGSYKGQLNCGGFPPTKVISVSYAQPEFHQQSTAYLVRQCNEYMKLGLMGISIFYSSGDTGVAAGSIFGAVCINTTNNQFELSEDGGRFAPLFPATCPYVTAVGATQVIPGTNVTAALASGTEPEEACETVIYSGGGFSDVFGIPSYQNATVQAYFTNHKPPYSGKQYNNTRKSRGYPDVSANGANYNVAINGSFELVYGTSASAPTFASIITLINEKRAAAGKSTVGFINPVAYAHPEVFNDITRGDNPGCNTTGFAAVSG